jgi:hypothetical protein
VLCLAGLEICHYQLDIDALKKALN